MWVMVNFFLTEEYFYMYFKSDIINTHVSSIIKKLLNIIIFILS